LDALKQFFDDQLINRDRSNPRVHVT
jgi:hypothetical protein